MPTLKRVRVQISGGGVVGPSVSTFFFSASHTGFNADLIALYTAVKGRLPSTTLYNIPADGDTIDEASGALVGSWSDGIPTQVAGTATNQAPMGVGLRVVWLTTGLSGGRRVRGSTFFVPLDATMYAPDGSLSASISDFTVAANNFVTAGAGEFRIWTRPKAGSGGGSSSVTGYSVPDKVTTLRSRRT